MNRTLMGIALLGSLLFGASPVAWAQVIRDGRVSAESPDFASPSTLRFEGNVVLLDEVYVSVLEYAGWRSAGGDRARWIEQTLEEFLHRSGYQLATVEAKALPDDEGYVLQIDEGKLDKIIFRNVGSWTTVRLIFLLDLPEKVFNRSLLERRLVRIKDFMNIREIRYQVVPTTFDTQPRFQLQNPSLIDDFALLRPGEPHELRISLETVERDSGFDLGLSVQPPDGLMVHFGYLLPSVLVPKDRVELESRFGLRFTDIGRSPSNRAGISRVGARASWSSPALADLLRFTSRLDADVEARRRDDLSLLNYFFAPVGGALGFTLEKDGVSLFTGAGLEYRSFFGADADNGAEVPALAGVEQDNLRAILEAEFDWIFNPFRLRRDRPHELVVSGRFLWPVADSVGDIYEANLVYRNTLMFGFDELRYRAKAIYREGTVPFYAEVAMGDGFLRSAFQGDVFSRIISGASAEYRVSLNRDVLKFGFFNDIAVYDALDLERRSDGVQLIDNLGVGLHVLILDAFQIDAYMGVGLRTDGELDFGLSLNASQAY